MCGRARNGRNARDIHAQVVDEFDEGDLDSGGDGGGGGLGSAPSGSSGGSRRDQAGRASKFTASKPKSRKSQPAPSDSSKVVKEEDGSTAPQDTSTSKFVKDEPTEVVAGSDADRDDQSPQEQAEHEGATSHGSGKKIRVCADVSGNVDRWEASNRENLAPGTYIPILRNARPTDDEGAASKELVVDFVRWGLIPSYTKPGDPHNYFRMFNARSETVLSNRVFARLVRRKRCVVLLQGFYEWKKVAKKSQPYYLHDPNMKTLYVAGLYDELVDKETGSVLRTCTMMTKDASKSIRWLHDRQPLILPDAAAVKAWLDPDTEPQAAWQAAVKTANAMDNLKTHPVTPKMTSMKYREADASHDMTRKKSSIKNMFAAVGKRNTSSPTKAPPKPLKSPTKRKAPSEPQRSPAPKKVPSPKKSAKAAPRSMKSIASFFAKASKK